MKLPQIRIESQLARIQIRTTPARQEIRQPEAELTIRQPQAEVSIQTTPGRLQIDQTQAWEDMNLMHVFRLNEKFVDEAKADWSAGIARRAQQGTELMQIENGGNPLASQATANAYDGKKALGITFIPSPFAVKTDYQPAEVEIDVQTNPPVIDAKQQQPVHNYYPGSVETSLKQQAELDITFTNLFA
ncbi:DUF6470 family protein [Lentibacillus sediminis]|uniref:DUF6470 family protein n=1 Tax=Lentibacillus sediminis TaxID=1940529 RepID=UPI000C1BEE57|nr:DUF6470 family protein [Lentibacillus sediminis]